MPPHRVSRSARASQYRDGIPSRDGFDAASAAEDRDVEMTDATAEGEDMDDGEIKELRCVYDKITEYLHGTDETKHPDNIVMLRAHVVATLIERARTFVLPSEWHGARDETMVRSLAAKIYDIEELTSFFMGKGFLQSSPRGSIFGRDVDGAHVRRIFRLHEMMKGHDGYELTPDSQLYDEVKTSQGFVLVPKAA